MDTKLDIFYKTFLEELSVTKANSGYEKEIDCFTELMLQYLEEVGQIDDPTVFSYKDSGIQVNAYEFSTDKTQLTMFVSIYNQADALMNVPKSDIEAAMIRGANIVTKAFYGKFNSFQKDNDMYGLAQQILNAKKTLTDINIIALTNGLVKEFETAKAKIGTIPIRFNVWDMDRLSKCVFSGQEREPINIDIRKYLGKPLTVLKGGKSSKTTVYLAILPGDFLVNVYSEFRDKLLERNVRAYLQRKGDVNKGIISTIQDQPDMFLAYNNGITVTAASVELAADSDTSQNEVFIEKINDFQIVNGGQTTVSLFMAKNDKTYESDFSKIYVQMKLAVAQDDENLEEIVPNISKFSNLQNKVQTADFSSNDPYNREMESLSRRIWSPSLDGRKPVQWFFERARGQYASALNAEPTPSKRKDFKEHHPLITKTDLAKVLLSWNEKPQVVSLGAQKAFNQFMKDIKDGSKFIPDQEYFQHAIAKVILFKKIEKLVMQQKFGGYRANIVAYTYFKLMRITERRLDINSIWESQDISSALENQIIIIAKAVQNYLVSGQSGVNVSEYCKSAKCVAGINGLDVALTDELKAELAESEQIDTFAGNSYMEEELSEEEKKIIDSAWAIPSKEWRAMANWAKDNHYFTVDERNVLFKMATIKARNKKRPNLSTTRQALSLHQQCIAKGIVLL